MQAPTSPTANADDIGSLARLDSLDEYFMLNSPPESPGQPVRTSGNVPLDSFQYYPGSGSNAIAPQGNSKMSTKNFAVDRSNALERSNSFGFGRILPSTQRDIEEMLKMDDKELNLSELFLQSSQRRSLNENYEAKGALKGHDKDLHRSRTNSLASSFMGDGEGGSNVNKSNQAKASLPTGTHKPKNSESSIDFDLDVEPTPLSEIKAKSEERKRLREEATRQIQQRGQEQNQSRPSSGELTAQRLDQHHYEQRRRKQQHSSNYYPFGRSYQLPIPTMPPNSPPGAKNNDVAQIPLADAVATAAALASVQKPGQTKGAPASTSTTSNQTYQQLPSHTPPQTPPLHPASPSGWTKAGGSNSQSPHQHNNHSPTSAPHQQHQYSHHPSQLQQPSLSHPHHHTGHPTYAGAHHPGAPLAVGTMHPPPKIVGPYTTAQQGGGNGRRSITSTSTAVNGTTKTVTTKPSPAPAPPATYLPRRGDHMPREASAAHTTPKGVLAEAAKQRRGYSGFHKPATSQTTNTYHHPLPSKFPNYSAPTTPSNGARPPPPPLAQKPGESQVKSSQPAPPNSYANGMSHLHRGPAQALNHQPTDTAYERKKQRAKDARVKLNESIERLHVSMGVAGTESSRRADQLRNFMKQAGREHENSTDHQAFQLMDSCVTTAESAKKWDRPNFVGSAATMIQCLNSQCEMLMKELMEYQEAKPPVERPGRPSPSVEGESSEMTATTSGPQKDPSDKNQKVAADTRQQRLKEGKRSIEDPPVNEGTEGGPEKRRRLNGVHHNDDEKKEANSTASDGAEANSVSRVASTSWTICTPRSSSPVQLEESVMDLIASFLDPVSLVQCARVCKAWRENGQCFGKDEIWTNLCIKRFGQLKTRQWQENQVDFDDDEGANVQDGDEVPRKVQGLVLYRAMNSADVMPALQLDGRNHVLIGRGRLPGGEALAWMFAVERSNGETMRSVKRNPTAESSSRNAGAYSSLPVVEVRIVIQNVGGRTSGQTPLGRKKDAVVGINQQLLAVDASTRRRREELPEIDWDDRFRKKTLCLDGSDYEGAKEEKSHDKLARLKLFDAVVLCAFIHARRCSTTTKFVQRSNFLRILLSVGDSDLTQALVIPIAHKQVEG